MRVGLISDTHNLLRPEAVDFLRGVDHIVHAGDICGAGILSELASLAPLTAVRGNNDKGAWAGALQELELVRLQGARLCVIHELKSLQLDLVSEGVQVVVSGHSHKPGIRQHEGVLYVNPGSAGPRRFRLPVTAAELTIDGDRLSARIVDLQSLS